MLSKSLSLCILLFWLTPLYAATVSPEHPQPSSIVSTVDVLVWGGGLLLVLAVFFVCVWFVRKLNGMAVNDADKLRMLGGLSLGLREKIILLQVGKKQLVLGVTPNRIETLLVLEGEDCLMKEDKTTQTSNSFSQKFKEAIKADMNG